MNNRSLPNMLPTYLILILIILFNGFSKAQWVQSGLNNKTIYRFVACGNYIFVSTDSGIYKSTDKGSTWIFTSGGLTTNIAYPLAVSGTTIFAGTYTGGIFISTDFGASWVQANHGLPTLSIHTIATCGNHIFAGLFDQGVFHSSDNGLNWISVNASLTNVGSLAAMGDKIFVSIPELVLVSTDYGINWTETNLLTKDINSLAVSGTNIFAGAGNSAGIGVYRSTDYGANWTLVNNGLLNKYVGLLATSGTYIFATTLGGIYSSTNSGTNWIFSNYGLPTYQVSSVAIVDSFVYAGIYMGGVWRRPLSDFPLPVALSSFTANVSIGTINLNWKTATEVNNMGFDVERSGNKTEWTKIIFIQGNQTSTSTNTYSYDDKSVSKAGKYYYRLKQIDNNGSNKYSNIVQADFIAPSDFALNQNYPNPFNPSTEISYAITFKSKVTLIIYDAIGTEVATLVNEEKPVGYYDITFNAGKLASGVYYCRMAAGDFVQTRKLILLK